MNIQKTLFNIAKEKISPQFRLADVICSLLDIGSDSAYRRIRGEKELTLSELTKICSHFDISMDAILNYKNDAVIFRHVSLDMSDMNNYFTYIEQFSKTIDTLATFRHGEIYYTAEDIPIFHFLPFPELSFFKVYVWYNSVCNMVITYEEFVKKIQNKENIYKHYQIMNQNYHKIASTEIWTVNTIDPILRLLEFYSDIESFESKNTPILLCNQLLQLIENLMSWTEKEKKNNKASFKLLLSPISPENSFMLVKNEEFSSTTIKLFTINSIITSQPTFCEQTEKWIKNTISKSSLLSGSAARERFKFFQSMKNKVNNLMEKFEQKEMY
ncbi:MAG: hypothetical protein LIP06_03990 [Tannerellaceae bacterium]|nr:hypothetical protein [Tannerellaceae bacterium]